MLFDATWRHFCAVLCFCMKHGFTCTHQEPINSRSTELHPANVRWRSRRRSNQGKSWWPLLSGNHKVEGTLATYRRTRKRQSDTMMSYWADSTLDSKNCPIGEGKSTVRPIECPGSHLPSFYGQIGWIGIWTATSFTILIRFGSDHLFCSQTRKVSCHTETGFKRGGHCHHGKLLWRSRENVSFGPEKEGRTSLGRVYRTKERLHHKINIHSFIILVLFW